MKYRNVEIKDMTSDALTEAQMLMWASEDFYKKRLATAQTSDSFKKRMKEQPLPPPNPHFAELKKALEDEMISRNLPLTGDETKVN